MDADIALPAETSAPGTARSFVRGWLRDHDLETLTDSAVLLTSELVTNAVLHAAAPVVLTLEPVAGGVRIAVSDGSPVPPARRRHSDEATTGRGLRLLTEVADSWGWEAAAGGKAVWCLVTTASDPWAAYSADELLSQVER